MFTWTKNPPTEIGWYWVKRLDRVYVTYFQEHMIKLCVQSKGGIVKDDVYWAGPIPEPDDHYGVFDNNQEFSELEEY